MFHINCSIYLQYLHATLCTAAFKYCTSSISLNRLVDDIESCALGMCDDLFCPETWTEDTYPGGMLPTVIATHIDDLVAFL